MKPLHLTPTWLFDDADKTQLDPRLLALLRAIDEHNKLTSAAEHCGLSYRHAWNLLSKWAEFFDAPLVEKHQGRGSRLSPLGLKLLWAEKRVNARLEPQLKSLSSEINLELAELLQGQQPVLRMHASHGYAVALLPKLLGDAQFDLQYCSPAEALSALARNACDLAGFHIPIGPQVPVIKEYRKRLKPRSHRIIPFITRQQGLMVAKGNPHRITGLSDLSRDNLQFINRQSSAGTRALLDTLLRDAGVNSRHIKGYGQEEFTHSAVAAFIAAGMADAGFGVEAAARQFDLDFIPLVKERYVVACHKQLLTDPKMKYFLDVIRSEDFALAIETLAGYRVESDSNVLELNDVFNS